MRGGGSTKKTRDGARRRETRERGDQVAPRWGEHLVEQEKVNRASILKADAYEYLAQEFETMEDNTVDEITRRSSAGESFEQRGNRTNNGINNRTGYDEADDTWEGTASGDDHDLGCSNSAGGFGARPRADGFLPPQPAVPYGSHEEPSAGSFCGASADADVEDRNEFEGRSPSECDTSDDDNRVGSESDFVHHKVVFTTNAKPRPGKRWNKPRGGVQPRFELEDVVADEPVSRVEIRPDVIDGINNTSSRRTDDEKREMQYPAESTHDDGMEPVTVTPSHRSHGAGARARERTRSNRRLLTPDNELTSMREKREGKDEEDITASAVVHKAAGEDGEENVKNRKINNGIAAASSTPSKEGSPWLEGFGTGTAGEVNEDEKMLAGVIGSSERSLLYSPRRGRKQHAVKTVDNEIMPNKNALNCAEERMSPSSLLAVDPDHGVSPPESELFVVKRRVCHLQEELHALNEELRKAEMRYVAAEATAAAVLDRARAAELSRDVKEIQVHGVALR